MNFFAINAHRISAAIDPFVMLIDHHQLAKETSGRSASLRTQSVDAFGFHDTRLRLACRFAQYLFIDIKLTDVMQQAACCDFLDFFLRVAHLFG